MRVFHADAVELLARDHLHVARAAAAAALAGAEPGTAAGGGQLDELAVALVADESVHPHVAGVVPDVLRLDLEGEVVGGFFPVLFGVPAFVAAAAYVAADETDPEIIRAVADAAQGGFTAAEGRVGRVVLIGIAGWLRGRERGVRVSAHGTSSPTPFLQAGAVEYVLAEDGEEAGRVIHTLETDGAGRQLDEVRGWWWEWFQEGGRRS